MKEVTATDSAQTITVPIETTHGVQSITITPPPPSAPSKNGLVAWLALSLSLAASGILVFLVVTERRGDTRMAIQFEQITAQNRVLQEKIAKQDLNIANQKATVQSLGEHLLRQAQNQTITELQGMMMSANQRLHLQHDVAGARYILTLAMQMIDAEPGQFLTLRQKIVDALEQLDQVKTPDRTALAQTMNQWIKAAPTWAMRSNVRFQPSVAAPILAKKPPTWWQKAQNALDPFIRIRFQPRPVGLAAPQESAFVKQNLLLKLETARLALYQEDTATWQNNMVEISEILRTQYHAETLQTNIGLNQIVTQIEQFKTLELKPVLPDLSAGLRLLESEKQSFNNLNNLNVDMVNISNNPTNNPTNKDTNKDIKASPALPTLNIPAVEE